MLLIPAALALTLASLACLAVAPLALAIAASIVVWTTLADVEIAIVVSRRRQSGARGQQTIASARTTPRKAIGTAAGAVVGVLALARRAAGTVRGVARRWAETEQAARWADGARTLADVGPAALTVGAVVALPWVMLAAPDGAGAAAGALAMLAIARWGIATAGARYRVDI